MKKVSKSMMIFSAFFFIVGSHENRDLTYFGYVNNNKNKIVTCKPEPVAKWTGTLKREEKVTHSNEVIVGTVVRHAEVFFTAALPTMNRDIETTDLNFTDDKGTGNITVHADLTNLLTKQKCITDCTGSGIAELHTVIIREWDNTYDIEAIVPICRGTTCDGQGGSQTYEEEMMTISVSNEKFTDKDVLSGTKTVTSEMPGGLGTGTATTTWVLRRVKEDDVELIVTPVDYDKWLPVPGKDELTRGAVMTVELKLQGKNGKPLKAKADGFELRLNNTSVEPGITINYPVEPDPNQLPDLRFLLHPSIESLDPDQFVSVGSPDGITGKAMIASYDGGGWTILNAEAILKDGRRVQGRLLKPGGEIDIRIPKRDPNSHIGEAWLKVNGNPNEMDDIEKSNDNPYKGDGITAYEEYRGVVSESKFKRLDPTKKEVGVVARQKDFTLFKTGIGWFESASYVKVIRFDYDKDEIQWTSRLNSNAKTSHDFDQYAIYLADGGIGGRTLGVCYGKGLPMIPANIIGVIIDWAAIQRAYQNRINEAKPQTPKFSLQDYLAQTVAHELGHAVNIDHHGNDIKYDNYDATQKKYVPYVVNDVSDRIRIFDRQGNLITNRPFSLFSIGAQTGTVEGGSLSCMLNYYPYYQWGYSQGADGAHIYNQERLISLGRIFCKSIAATDFNATQLYFGDAAQDKGNCLGQIQLRN